MAVKFPNIKVKLVGTDGNAFAILAKVRAALRDNGVNAAKQQEFYAEVTAGDYNHLLATAMKWVEVE